MTKTAKKTSKDKKTMIAPNKSVPPVKPAAAKRPTAKPATPPASNKEHASIFPPERTPIAAPGMEVECILDGYGPWFGVIVHCHPEACIVRLDEEREREPHEDESDRVVALKWDKVLLRAPKPETPAQSPLEISFNIGGEWRKFPIAGITAAGNVEKADTGNRAKALAKANECFEMADTVGNLANRVMEDEAINDLGACDGDLLNKVAEQLMRTACVIANANRLKLRAL